MRKIFNFRSREIERFNETLDKELQVTAISPSIIQSFNEISAKDEIRDAHQHLCVQGGKPEPVTAYLGQTRKIVNRRTHS